jgi:hypothetical protein
MDNFAELAHQALIWFFLTTCCKKLKVSVFRCQDIAPRFPDTRNLTPET